MRALVGMWLAGLSLAASAAEAEPAGAGQPGETARPLYVKLVVGAFDPTDQFLEGFQPGPSVEGALGYAIAERASLELAVGRYRASTSQVGSNWLDLTVVPITLRLAVLMRVSGGAVYVDFGLGPYFTHMEGVLPLYAGSQVDHAVSGSDSKLGFNVGVGGEIALGGQLSLVLDVRYDVVSSTFFGMGGYLNGVRVGGGLLFHLWEGTPARTGEGPPPRDPLAP